jgi:hypothetical protein
MTVRKPSAQRRARRPAEVGDRSSTVSPPKRQARDTATFAAGTKLSAEELDAAILRFLRRFPNQTVELGPLAEQLGVDPYRIQLAVERLHWRKMVVAPFIEPGTAGGATLTELGLRWLIDREGGKPADTPTAYKPARKHVRTQDEAARLPRAQVYGIRRPGAA